MSDLVVGGEAVALEVEEIDVRADRVRTPVPGPVAEVDGRPPVEHEGPDLGEVGPGGERQPWRCDHQQRRLASKGQQRLRGAVMASRWSHTSGWWS